MTQDRKFFSDADSIPSLLERNARDRPRHVVIRAGSEDYTFDRLNALVNRAAHGLLKLGLDKSEHVAVMLNHHIDHVIVFFALMKIGAVQIPINVQLKGAGLTYMLEHASPVMMIAEDSFRETLEAAGGPAKMTRIWRGSGEGAHGLEAILVEADESNPAIQVGDSDLRTILYTSGTTGPAKGVEVIDRMLRAAALSSTWVGDIKAGNVLHFWDPIYHVFGSEVLVLSLMVPVTLVLVPRFSASRLWMEVKEAGATHIHFVGGVLQLLLKQTPSALDKTHGARIAWGGGCQRDVWTAFEERFGVEIREGYGMTETSSFSVINREGRVGSIGRAVDFFDVEIVDDGDKRQPAGQKGEIRVREREHGVMTRRYYNNPQVTAETIREGWLYTGDLGYADDDGFIYYLGRKKDFFRRRGENVSAWEVESVIGEHPDVEECALIGVKNEFGDEDLKIFIRRKEGSVLGPEELINWCEPRMASFQIPRFVAFVSEFRKTPTQRIQKGFLSNRMDDGCYDRENAHSA